MWIVSFTDQDQWARQWVEETCTAYPFLLDPERALYRSLGLDRSLLRSWNPRTLWRYLRYALSGRGLKPIQGDSSQLGGDFVFGPDAVLRFAHRSQDPVDRPPVDDVIAALAEAKRH